MSGFLLFTATIISLSGALFFLIRGIDKNLAEMDEADK